MAVGFTSVQFFIINAQHETLLHNTVFQIYVQLSLFN